MMPIHGRRLSLALLAGTLAGCAARTLPGYQNTFQGHQVPESLLDSVRQRLRQQGLAGAEIGRDSVGRVRLLGRYADEDEVDTAFTVVQTLVGLKSTSPFYPQQVAQRRWEQAAGQALQDLLRQRRHGGTTGPGVRRALVVGISRFLDPAIPPIQGADDALIVAEQLRRFNYSVTSLIGEAATKSAIEAAVARLKVELAPDDSLFVFISSHGAPPVPSPRGGDERKMSIVAYDSSTMAGGRSGDGVDQAVQLQRTAVRDGVLQDLARQPTRFSRVLIDTCYSGEILRGVPESSRQFILQQNGGRPDRAGVSVASWTGAAYASKAIQVLDADGKPVSAVTPGTAAAATSLANRTGYTLITATSEGEKAFGPSLQKGSFSSPVSPGKELRGSFFTQAFMAWLEFHQGRLQPAFEQAARFTSTTVAASGEKQTPRIHSNVQATADDLRNL